MTRAGRRWVQHSSPRQYRKEKQMTCQLWGGPLNRNGYPVAGKTLMHRASLALKLGRPVRQGWDACHTCDNRACVNADHLYEGSRKQNMADCSERARHNKPRGETHWRSRLSASDVAEMRRMSEEGASRKELGERFDVNAATVSRIVRGLWRTEERPMAAPDYLTGVTK